MIKFLWELQYLFDNLVISILNDLGFRINLYKFLFKFVLVFNSLSFFLIFLFRNILLFKLNLFWKRKYFERLLYFLILSFHFALVCLVLICWLMLVFFHLYFLLLELYLFILLELLMSQHYMLIISLLGLCLHFINSLTPCTFNILTGTKRINNISSTYSTCKDTIKRKTLYNLITHTTNIKLGIPRHGLTECTFIAIYIPKFK